MKHACSVLEAIVRLSPQSPTRMLLRQIEASTCLQNPSQSCDTFSGCSLTKIVWCLTLPADREVRCERLSRLVQRIFLELNSMQTSPNEPILVSTLLEGCELSD